MPRIQINQETKELVDSFGSKKETYETKIRRIYDFAIKTQLREFLLSSKNTITIDEARAMAKKKYLG